MKKSTTPPEDLKATAKAEAEAVLARLQTGQMSESAAAALAQSPDPRIRAAARQTITQGQRTQPSGQSVADSSAPKSRQGAEGDKTRAEQQLSESEVLLRGTLIGALFDQTNKTVHGEPEAGLRRDADKKDPNGPLFDPKNDAVDRAYEQATPMREARDAVRYSMPDLRGDWGYAAPPSGGRYTLPGVATAPAAPFVGRPATFKPILNEGDKVQARAQLMDAIDRTSALYAKEAGVSAGFMQQVLDGTAVIESSYGVLREVKGTKYVSSAGGAFHMLDTHVQTMVNKYGHRPEIMAQLRDLGVNPKQQLSSAQAWAIKENDHLAASFVALETVEKLKSNPHLKTDAKLATGHAYMTHNLGAGGAAAAMAGGADEVTRRYGPQIVANNPSMIRPGMSPAQVESNYVGMTNGAIDAAAALRQSPVVVAQRTIKPTDSHVTLAEDPKKKPAATLASVILPAPAPTLR